MGVPNHSGSFTHLGGSRPHMGHLSPSGQYGRGCSVLAQKPHFLSEPLAAMVFRCSLFMNRHDFVQNESLNAVNWGCRGDGGNALVWFQNTPLFSGKIPSRGLCQDLVGEKRVFMRHRRCIF